MFPLRSFVLPILLAAASDLPAQSPGPRPVGKASEQAGQGDAGKPRKPRRAGPAIGAQPKPNDLPLYPFDSEFRFWTQRMDLRVAGSDQDGKDEDLRQTLQRLHTYYVSSTHRSFDEKGRPFCPHPQFAKLRDDLLPMLTRKAGWFAYILKDSRWFEDRRLAAFGLLFCPEEQTVLWGFCYGAYEPQTLLRRQFLGWAHDWVSKRLGTQFTEEDVKNVYPPTPANRARIREGKHRLSLEFVHTQPTTMKQTVLKWTDTWLHLLQAPKAPDRVLALRMLSATAKTRPDAAAEALLRGQDWIASNLQVESDDVRSAARDFVTALDPENPCPEATAAAKAHFDALMDRLFPQIQIQGGLGLLFDGSELDEIVELGEQLLESGKLGYPARGEANVRGRKRTIHGLKLNPLPEALQKLGLETGTLIHTVDGSPIRSCKALLDLLRAKAKVRSRSFVVEYLDPLNKPGLRRYVLKGKRR